MRDQQRWTNGKLDLDSMDPRKEIQVEHQYVPAVINPRGITQDGRHRGNSPYSPYSPSSLVIRGPGSKGLISLLPSHYCSQDLGPPSH